MLAMLMGTSFTIVYVFRHNFSFHFLCLYKGHQFSINFPTLLHVSRQVALFYEDGRPVDGKGVGRKVLDRVRDTYDSELSGKEFAYDGEKSLFTVGSLPRNKLEFTVVLEDVTSSRYVKLSFA